MKYISNKNSYRLRSFLNALMVSISLFILSIYFNSHHIPKGKFFFDQKAAFKIVSFESNSDYPSSDRDHSYCDDWKLNETDITTILKNGTEINGPEWHHLFLHLPCMYEGTFVQNDQSYSFGINGASWFTIQHGNTSITYGDVKGLNASLFISKTDLLEEDSTGEQYELLYEDSGDLNGDGIDEKVLVYATGEHTDSGAVREIQLLKYVEGEWVVWLQSTNALLNSEEGGMMGDPLSDVFIADGNLQLSFSGGTSWKWSYTDTYRLNNGSLELLAFESFYGKPCEYFEQWFFDLSTGEINWKKEFDSCEEQLDTTKTLRENFYYKGVKRNLMNRRSKELKIVSPKYKHEFYL